MLSSRASFLLALVCCFLVDLSAASGQEPALRMPKNARELAMMRAYYDKTVWPKEVMAQDYERAVVSLWDKLIQPTDKFQALLTAQFDLLQIGAEPRTNTLDWGIQQTEFGGSKDVRKPEWPALLESFEEQGYRIVETEWHHSEFVPPQDSEPARSVFSVSIYATHSKSNRRFVVKGDVRIQWQPERDAATKMFQPKLVDATGVSILSRQGDDVFVEKRVETFQLDPAGRAAPPTAHPIILQDLNGDHLPEICAVGVNKVFWNKGDWNFEEDKLVAVPARYVNAGAFGDFTGDGVLDLICAPKLGMPSLFVGEPGGQFSTAGRELKIASKRLQNPVGFTAGDIDGDGDLDLFIGQNKVGYQTGEIPTPYYDARDSFPSYLLLNDGKGNFSDATAAAGLSGKNTRRNFASSFVDLDDDGDLDLLLTNDFQGNDLFLNDGKGVFTDVSETLTPTSYGHGMSHSFGDYDLDGRLDFISIAMSSTTARRLDKLQLGRSDFPEHNRVRKHMGYGNRLYLNRDKGFQQASFNASVARTGWSWGSTTFDFDRDGDADIYVANGQMSGKTTRDYCTRYWCHDLYYQSDTRPKEAISDFFNKMTPLFANRSMSWNGYEHNALLMNQDGKGFY